MRRGLGPRRMPWSFMHRRRFTQIVGGLLLAPLSACRSRGPDGQAIARLLGLRPGESAWIEQLTTEARGELRAMLERPGDSRTARAVDLAFPILGDRSRTFAFVGYPAAQDRRSVCDGLLVE